MKFVLIYLVLFHIFCNFVPIDGLIVCVLGMEIDGLRVIGLVLPILT